METKETGTDPLAFSAADAAAESNTEQTDENADNGTDTDLLHDEDDTADEETSEGESKEKSEDEDEEDVELLEDEDEKGSNPLALDKEVADALPPAVKKRYEQHAAGLLKKEGALVKREGTVAEQEQQYASLAHWDLALSDPRTAWDAHRAITESLTKAHGPDPKAAKGSTEEASEGFEFESDVKVKNAAVEAAVAAMKKELGIDPKELQTFIASQKTEVQKAQTAKQVDEILPRVVATLKAKYTGWTPKPADIRAALLAGDIKNPIATVKRALVDDLVAHTATKSKAVAGPERIRGGQTPGKTLNPDPLKTSVADFLT